MNKLFYEPVTTPCVISTYAKNKAGYAMVGVVRNGKSIPVLHHRLVYAKAHNLSPAEMKHLVVMHKCDNPGCIRLDHLLLTTQALNMRDMALKGRSRGHNAGELPHNAKLNWGAVAKIRARATESTELLAKEFKVSKSAIQRIINKDTWKC